MVHNQTNADIDYGTISDLLENVWLARMTLKAKMDSHTMYLMLQENK